MKVNVIYARAENGAFGNKGQMPWPKLHSDMARFKELTVGHSVIMGRKTWDSLPRGVRPLPGRNNIVVSKSSWKTEGELLADDPLMAIDTASRYSDQCFVIGGPSIINFLWPYYSAAYVTQVDGDYQADVFMENPLDQFMLVKQTTILGQQQRYTMQEWLNPNAPTDAELADILRNHRVRANVVSSMKAEGLDVQLPTGFKMLDDSMQRICRDEFVHHLRGYSW